MLKPVLLMLFFLFDRSLFFSSFFPSFNHSHHFLLCRVCVKRWCGFIFSFINPRDWMKCFPIVWSYVDWHISCVSKSTFLKLYHFLIDCEPLVICRKWNGFLCQKCLMGWCDKTKTAPLTTTNTKTVLDLNGLNNNQNQSWMSLHRFSLETQSQIAFPIYFFFVAADDSYCLNRLKSKSLFGWARSECCLND